MDYLNLGCGSHFHPDWTNVNFKSTGEGVIAHNLRDGIPFDDEEFDVVYHSHVLEHFSKDEGTRFIQECCRVLRPGGVLRVVVPDLETIARLYIESLEHALAGSAEWATHYHWILLEMYDQVVRTVSGGAMADYLRQDLILNEEFVVDRLGQEAEVLIQTLRRMPKRAKVPPAALSGREALLRELLGDDDYDALQAGRFRQGGEIHQWMYDRYSLTVLLEQYGFEAVKVCQHDESEIPHFRDFYLDTRSDGRVRKPDSLFVEARKSYVHHDVDSLNSFPQVLTQDHEMLHRAQPRNLEDLPQFQQLQQQIVELQQQVDELQSNLGQSRKRAKRLKTERDQLQHIIAAMESSTFWKARAYWQRVRQLLKTR